MDQILLLCKGVLKLMFMIMSFSNRLKSFWHKLCSKNISYIISKNILNTLYSLDSFQIILYVPITYYNNFHIKMLNTYIYIYIYIYIFYDI